MKDAIMRHARVHLQEALDSGIPKSVVGRVALVIAERAPSLDDLGECMSAARAHAKELGVNRAHYFARCAVAIYNVRKEQKCLDSLKNYASGLIGAN